MPFPYANLSKRTLRHYVAQAIGDYLPLTTSSAGNVGGTTEVFASLINDPIATLQNRYIVLESGTNDGEWRVVQAFVPASGTITVRRAHTGQVASGVTAVMHEYSPANYSLALSEAVRAVYPAAFRTFLHHAFIRQPGIQRTIGLPRGMDRVRTVREDVFASTKIHDYFDLTTLRSWWAQQVGAFGFTLGSVYCTTDNDGDLLVATPYVGMAMLNGVIETSVRGDTTNGASRTLATVFRMTSDFTNALAVRLINDTVQLRKLDNGTWSTLTSAAVTTTEDVNYLLRVMFDGAWVSVWVDNVQLIQYQLLGTDTKYAGETESSTPTFGGFGLRLEKTGAPSLGVTSTRADHFFAHEIVGTMERNDWRMSQDLRQIELNVRGRGWLVREERMLWLDGTSFLSSVAADGNESLTSDSTAIVEIETTDPSFDILIQHAGYLVLDKESKSSILTPERQAAYAQLAAAQLGRAAEIRSRMPMRRRVRNYYT